EQRHHHGDEQPSYARRRGGCGVGVVGTHGVSPNGRGDAWSAGPVWSPGRRGRVDHVRVVARPW
ncbi:hypothetical protein, partial [Micromonospora aurantiaca (nom. illeg.)]|uniref:hypothetical protein n=1 Tax=Micromonospora aurantiaca (nom. illeg.) TaxID=47850 RepID=UPI0035B2FF04